MSIEKQKMIAGEHYRLVMKHYGPTDYAPDTWFTVITTLHLMRNSNARTFWRNSSGKAKGPILSRASAVTMDITFIWAKNFTPISIA